jgi:hypothetical protein
MGNEVKRVSRLPDQFYDRDGGSKSQLDGIDSGQGCCKDNLRTVSRRAKLFVAVFRAMHGQARATPDLRGLIESARDKVR